MSIHMTASPGYSTGLFPLILSIAWFLTAIVIDTIVILGGKQGGKEKHIGVDWQSEKEWK